jgi:hypothetical protein
MDARLIHGTAAGDIALLDAGIAVLITAVRFGRGSSIGEYSGSLKMIHRSAGNLSYRYHFSLLA